MKSIVFLTDMDYAGSGCQAVEALKSVGGFERVVHVALRKHPWEFPYDFVLKNLDGTMDGIDYCNVKRIVDRAALVHIWNVEPDWKELDRLEIPKEKIKSATYTGSLYRLDHTRINRKLNNVDISITVQNPSYRYLDEIDSVYIPHAIPIEQLDTIETGLFRQGDISVYSRGPGKRKTTTREEDIAYLESIIKDDWKLVQRELVPWWNRMRNLPKSQIHFEYLENTVQWFGRSTLEACCLGVPSISWYSDRALELSEGKVGIPAILRTDRSNLEQTLVKLERQGEDKQGWDELTQMSINAIEWVKRYFSYKVIGEQYKEFFEKVLK